MYTEASISNLVISNIHWKKWRRLTTKLPSIPVYGGSELETSYR